MNGKVTAVKFAGVEGLIEVVNLGVSATSCLALVLELEAVLPHAWTRIHCIVARSIIFIQDKNCSSFTVMKSVSIGTTIGTFVLFRQIFLPLVDIKIFFVITISLPLLHYFHSFSSFFCADYEVFFWYRSLTVGVKLFLVYIVMPVLTQGFYRISLCHQLSNIMKRFNLCYQCGSTSFGIFLLHTLKFFVQVCEPFLFYFVVVSKIFDLRLEDCDAVVWCVIHLLNFAVFAEFVRL